MITTLRSLIQEAFPPVDRPNNLTVHGNECFQCSWLNDELKEERESTLSTNAVRWLIGELSLLSPEGFRWILPSYLEAVISYDSDSDLGEFLAYHFSGDNSGSELQEHIERLNILSNNQIICLIDVLSYIRKGLGEVYYSDVDKAISTLKIQSIKMQNKA